MSIEIIKLNKFLIGSNEELDTHAQIVKKNLNTFIKHEKNVVDSSISLLDSLKLQTNTYNDCVNSQCQNALHQIGHNEEATQVAIHRKNIREKEKSIIYMEQNLKKLEEEHNNLKALKAKEEQENHDAVKAFKKALKFFTKYLQYNIKVGVKNEEKCCYLTFLFEGQEFKHPIRFIFDKQGNISGFSAESLMSIQQQTQLFERYKKNYNILALLCTLRNVALKKHTS